MEVVHHHVISKENSLHPTFHEFQNRIESTRPSLNFIFKLRTREKFQNTKGVLGLPNQIESTRPFMNFKSKLVLPTFPQFHFQITYP
jgi:hypothetical protein